MTYAVETASGGMIYIASFIHIGSGVKLLGVIHIQMHRYRHQGDLISLILFFQNRESSLKRHRYFTAQK
jgi:hypothetical protein